VRILLTTDVVGGVWSYTEELVDALRGRGHLVSLVSLGGEPRADHRAWLAARPDLPCTALPHALEWMPEPEPSLTRSIEELRRIADGFRPDVVHLNQYVYGAHELGAPALVVAHSDVVGWWRAVRGGEPPDDEWFRRYRGWVGAGLRGAARRAAPSASLAREIAADYGVDSDVVLNARSAARFSASPVRDPIVVSVGRLWDEAKGARDLVGAAALLHGTIDVVLAGPARPPTGEPPFPVEAPGVRYAGLLPRDALASLLGRAAIYVASSRYEPFGLAPLEAALAGCALVMTDIPTFRELWHGAAEFYPPGDVNALADRIRRLDDDPARRAALADGARARAVREHSPERMADGYERLYRAMLNRTRPAGAA
jgi:glycogen synthase